MTENGLNVDEASLLREGVPGAIIVVVSGVDVLEVVADDAKDDEGVDDVLVAVCRMDDDDDVLFELGMQPKGPPRSLIFRKTKRPPMGFIATIVQSLRWTKSNLPPLTLLVKSLKGMRTVERWPGVV